MKKSFGNTETGFGIPENYFGEFNDRLFSKLEERSPFRGKATSGFKAPEGYFENFKVPLPEGARVIPLFKRREVWAYVASIAAVLALVLTFYRNNPQVALSFSDIGEKSIETYIENGQIDFSDMEVQTFLLEETKLGNLSTSLRTGFDEISDEALYDYLAAHENELPYLNR